MESLTDSDLIHQNVKCDRNAHFTAMFEDVHLNEIKCSYTGYW